MLSHVFPDFYVLSHKDDSDRLTDGFRRTTLGCSTGPSRRPRHFVRAHDEAMEAAPRAGRLETPSAMLKKGLDAAGFCGRILLLEVTLLVVSSKVGGGNFFTFF